MQTVVALFLSGYWIWISAGRVVTHYINCACVNKNCTDLRCWDRGRRISCFVLRFDRTLGLHKPCMKWTPRTSNSSLSKSRSLLSRVSLQKTCACFLIRRPLFSGMCAILYGRWTGGPLSGRRHDAAGAEGAGVREAVAQPSEGEKRSSLVLP